MSGPVGFGVVGHGHADPGVGGDGDELAGHDQVPGCRNRHRNRQRSQEQAKNRRPTRRRDAAPQPDQEEGERQRQVGTQEQKQPQHRPGGGGRRRARSLPGPIQGGQQEQGEEDGQGDPHQLPLEINERPEKGETGGGVQPPQGTEPAAPQTPAQHNPAQAQAHLDQPGRERAGPEKGVERRQEVRVGGGAVVGVEVDPGVLPPPGNQPSAGGDPPGPIIVVGRVHVGEPVLRGRAQFRQVSQPRPQAARQNQSQENRFD